MEPERNLRKYPQRLEKANTTRSPMSISMTLVDLKNTILKRYKTREMKSTLPTSQQKRHVLKKSQNRKSQSLRKLSLSHFPSKALKKRKQLKSLPKSVKWKTWCLSTMSLKLGRILKSSNPTLKMMLSNGSTQASRQESAMRSIRTWAKVIIACLWIQRKHKSKRESKWLMMPLDRIISSQR